MKHSTHRLALGAGLLLVLAPSTAPAAAPLLKLRAVPFTDVQINDSFWTPRRETNRLVSIPLNFDMLEKSGNIRNLERAAARATSGFEGPVFMDSDLYKALEAAAYSLATHPDPILEKRVDAVIAKIAAAQEPDGYLNTHFTVKAPDKKWTNLRDWHELYCAGHLFEAAAAHYLATGKKTLLDVATKLAGHIDRRFGPNKKMGYPGHPEIELALIKLWRVTGDVRYFNLARFFIESRGQKFFATEHNTPFDKYDGSYWQDDIAICDHNNIKGHAVRAAYLLSGTTDVVAETGDTNLLRMLNRVWRNTTEKNQYITGGIGPSAHNEGFTEDYDLPNLTAYQETCASIALAQWAQRMAMLYGDARYADVFERALYNGVLSGVSQDGTKFFYVNPLGSTGHHHRSGWFGCACCPPNVCRTLASLGGYAYATGADALYVNLYLQGAAKLKLAGQPVTLRVTTEYPWDGKVVLSPEITTPQRFKLNLRVPGWCEGATVRINGRAVAKPAVDRGYLVLDREWKKGDRVQLDLPMPVQQTVANPNVKADAGMSALQRGPLVYCLEGADNDVPFAALYLPAGAALEAKKEPRLLGGVVAVRGEAEISTPQDWDRRLYQAMAAVKRTPITAIPYYAWDNRAAGPMQVWFPLAPPAARIGGIEALAQVKVSFANDNAQPVGINDGIEPKNSGEQPAALCHWWPHRGSDEWVQYTFAKPVTIGGSKVYWFDDTGRGNCRVPTSWQIEFLDSGTWKAVGATTAYPVAKDRWCEVRFSPVTTTALRLRVKMQSEWAAGAHEWKLLPVED